MATNLISDLAVALDPALMMRRLGMEPDDWQASLLRSDAKRMLLLCSRQSGKSTTAGVMALSQALYKAGSLALLLSPSLRQSQELFKVVAGFFQALGRPIPAAQESALRLELVNGSRIISLPGREVSIRGFSGVDLLVIDEAARVADDLYYSVRPMLAVSGGRLVGLSTPFGRRGWFYREFTEGDGWERVRVTAVACPRISAEFLEQERKSMPEMWFNQEYLCEFVEITGQLFSYEHVMGALSSEVQPLF
jgi:hypothetical protein